VIQNAHKIQEFCQEVCRRLLLETEVKNGRSLDDFLVAFDQFIQDKRYLESIYIQFKQNVLRTLIGKENSYEPLTAIEIVEMVEKLKWKSQRNIEFEQVNLKKNRIFVNFNEIFVVLMIFC